MANDQMIIFVGAPSHPRVFVAQEAGEVLGIVVMNRALEEPLTSATYWLVIAADKASPRA